KERKWGRIISVLNIGAKAPGADSAPTSVSRAAQMAFTKVLSQEGAPHNVLVNSLHVGVIVSDQIVRRHQREGANVSLEDFIAQKAHHQTRRKRPRLRGEVADTSDLNTGFLENFAAHRLFQSLARLHETGETREPSPGTPVAAAQQTALAPDREHNHDRIDAR